MKEPAIMVQSTDGLLVVFSAGTTHVFSGSNGKCVVRLELKGLGAKKDLKSGVRTVACHGLTCDEANRGPSGQTEAPTYAKCVRGVRPRSRVDHRKPSRKLLMATTQ